jgi:dienelactone hydrolase
VASEMAYECDGRSFCGYLADGSRGAAAPGVLVIHEASGLGPHARSRADMLASLGYVAFAPDIFGGPARTLDEAAAYIGELSGDVEKLRRRCGAALDNLRALSCVDREVSVRCEPLSVEQTRPTSEFLSRSKILPFSQSS